MAASSSVLLWVHTPNVSVAIDSTSGSLAHLNTSVVEPTSAATVGVSWDVVGGVSAGQNSVLPIPIAVSVEHCADPSGTGGGAVCVNSTWTVHGEQPSGTCCATYSVTVLQQFWGVTALRGPGVPSSIGWTTRFLSESPSWRTSLNASLRVLNGESSSYWVPRSGSYALASKTVFEDTTAMLRDSSGVNTSNMAYGLNFLCGDDGSGECGQHFSVPLGVLSSERDAAGVSLFAAVDDAIFGLRLDASQSALAFERLYNRLGNGKPVDAKYFIVPLAGADFRPIFGWARAAFPRFFVSPTLLAAQGQERLLSTVSSSAPHALSPSSDGIGGGGGGGGNRPAVGSRPGGDEGLAPV